MKKLKQPGGNISLKTKKNESPLVMEWLNAQTNLMDSLRYLIENEIRASGVRNLQTLIPMDRGPLVVHTTEPIVMVNDAAGTDPAESATEDHEQATDIRQLARQAYEEAEAEIAVAAFEEGEQPAVASPIQEARLSDESTSGEGDKQEAQPVVETIVDEEEIDEEDIESWL